jgi:hypothetical protein
MSPERRAFVAAALATAGGLLLLSGLVIWRLGGPKYASDVATLCDAEGRSGFGLRREMPALGDWIRGHVVTPRGNVLLARLGDLPMADRAAAIRVEAQAAGVAACPLADSYDAIVAEGATRADFQRLCSYVTFPDLATHGDAARLTAIEHWLATQATDPATRALADPLREATTPAERARLLRDASKDAGLLTCDIARVVETPLPPPDAGAPPLEAGEPDEPGAEAPESTDGGAPPPAEAGIAGPVEAGPTETTGTGGGEATPEEKGGGEE